ncbi:MAG: alpha/beta fold hydrolase, partial [Gammaproteobacteria bacterium]
MKLQANGIELEVVVEGPAAGEPLLMIMGLGMQLIAWPDEMVAELAARGFRVIRFDNRDIGLSQRFDHLGTPNLWAASMLHAMYLPVPASYRLGDMAADAVGVLDALGIETAHVCGASMGGMICQHLAARHPHRVRSVALMLTTSGSRYLPQPHWRVQQALIPPPRRAGLAATVDHLERMMNCIGSPAYRPDPVRQRLRLEAAVRRSYRPGGSLRQMMAIAADGDRSPLLHRVRAPAVVIHGADDPLVPAAAAADLIRKLPDAQLELIPGMGHDLP